MTTEASVSAPALAFQSSRDVAIHVADLDRAEAFYAGVLGFPLVNKTPDHLELDTGMLRLWVNRDAGAPQSFIPSLDVADVSAARRRLEAAGCTIVRESGGLYIRDPFGFVIDIIER